MSIERTIASVVPCKNACGAFFASSAREWVSIALSSSRSNGLCFGLSSNQASKNEWRMRPQGSVDFPPHVYSSIMMHSHPRSWNKLLGWELIISSNNWRRLSSGLLCLTKPNQFNSRPARSVSPPHQERNRLAISAGRSPAIEESHHNTVSERSLSTPSICFWIQLFSFSKSNHAWVDKTALLKNWWNFPFFSSNREIISNSCSLGFSTEFNHWQIAVLIWKRISLLERTDESSMR